MLEKSVSGVTNLWQLNNEYTTQIVFYLLTSFKHVFIILIRIFNHYNLIRKPYYFFKWVRCTRIVLHVWWCFSHDLDVVEIKNDNYGTPVSTSKVHLLFRVFQHQILVFLKAKSLFLRLHCLMTTNGQLNDTRGYRIKPTNYTCNMISGFRLKGPCSSVRGKNIYFCVSAVKF